MNETLDIPKHPSPVQVQASQVAKDPAHFRRPEGRVPYILRDQQALIQWQCNLEKLRLEDASDSQ